MKAFEMHDLEQIMNKKQPIKDQNFIQYYLKSISG